jgi:hypothetical protein
LKKLPKKIIQIIDVANYELNSKRVPKSEMKRSGGLFEDNSKSVLQYSCIIGSIPPKPHMRRSYATRSSVHSVKTAKTFVKAMVLAGNECLSLIKNITPSVYEEHKKCIEKKVPEKWRFAELFTSSISNFNISANVHRDNLNVKGTVNCIITKRNNTLGGNLFIPDYDLTINNCDNSLLVYPAWKNMHGVTPIVKTHENGYRNSLIWYSLDAFNNNTSPL